MSKREEKPSGKTKKTVGRNLELTPTLQEYHPGKVTNATLVYFNLRLFIFLF